MKNKRQSWDSSKLTLAVWWRETRRTLVRLYHCNYWRCFLIIIRPTRSVEIPFLSWLFRLDANSSQHKAVHISPWDPDLLLSPRHHSCSPEEAPCVLHTGHGLTAPKLCWPKSHSSLILLLPQHCSGVGPPRSEASPSSMCSSTFCSTDNCHHSVDKK